MANNNTNGDSDSKNKSSQGGESNMKDGQKDKEIQREGGGGTESRGFASMDEERRREIASKGGQSQGKENNPGNFANDPQRASEAGKKGGSSSR